MRGFLDRWILSLDFLDPRFNYIYIYDNTQFTEFLRIHWKHDRLVFCGPVQLAKNRYLGPAWFSSKIYLANMRASQIFLPNLGQDFLDGTWFGAKMCQPIFWPLIGLLLTYNCQCPWFMLSYNIKTCSLHNNSSLLIIFLHIIQMSSSSAANIHLRSAQNNIPYVRSTCFLTTFDSSTLAQVIATCSYRHLTTHAK